MSTPLTDGLAALRRAAAMAHTIGTISLRLSAGGRRILDVVPVRSGGGHGGPTIDPCRFRLAVARARSDHEVGQAVDLVGLRSDDPLDIRWSIVAPGHDLGFGAVRTFCAGRLVWAFASVLDPVELSDAMADMNGGRDGVVGSDAGDRILARLVHDEVLGATIVHVEVEPVVSTRVLDEVVRRMVAVVAAAEISQALV